MQIADSTIRELGVYFARRSYRTHYICGFGILIRLLERPARNWPIRWRWDDAFRRGDSEAPSNIKYTYARSDVATHAKFYNRRIAAGRYASLFRQLAHALRERRYSNEFRRLGKSDITAVHVYYNIYINYLLRCVKPTCWSPLRGYSSIRSIKVYFACDCILNMC